MQRYVAIVWDPDHIGSARTALGFRAALTREPAEWPIAHEGPGVLVVHAGTKYGSRETYRLGNNNGVILGKLFDRHHDYHSPRPIRFDEEETRKIVNSGGRHLISHYWGAYVAFIYDEATRTHHILHDPTGAMPCHHVRNGDVDVFFYSVTDCARLLPISFSPNRLALARWLVSFVEATRETCLEGVTEMPVGEGLCICRGQAAATILWDPVEIAKSTRFEHADEAARALRSTAQIAINAWASCYDRVAVRLSGGLDSSAVAGCLAQAPSSPQVSYLNEFAEITFDQEPVSLPGFDREIVAKTQALSIAGDERHFARLVAERWQVPLLDRRTPVAPDLSGMWQIARMARPYPDLHGTYAEELHRNLATSHGFQAFFTGHGGDQIFLACWIPLCAIDYAYLHGMSRGLWSQLVTGCNLSRLSLWAVARQVLRYGIRNRTVKPNRRFLTTPKLLTAAWLEDLGRQDFDSPVAARAKSATLPPGKRLHVEGLGSPAFYNSGPHREICADLVHPWSSQLMWEMALQIPTYNLQAGGTSRGLARRAFADVLPAQIRERQSKGTITPMMQHHLRTNRDYLRELLEDGLLVQAGLLDPEKLVMCLRAENPSLVVDAAHLGRCLGAEIWLRQWEQGVADTERQQQGARNAG